MSQFVNFFFTLQTNMKLYHLMTTSYARHKAADFAVDKIIELGDQFMETYIGKYGRPMMAKREGIIQLQAYDDQSVIKYLDSCITFLVVDAAKALKKDDLDLLNIRDEMVSALNQTKYLMTLK
jgi:hypothetical protein